MDYIENEFGEKELLLPFDDGTIVTIKNVGASSVTLQKVTGCIRCFWVYHDPAPHSMGIHRVPTECPQCGGRIIRTMTVDKWPHPIN